MGHLGCSGRRREETEGSVSTRVGDDSRCPDVIVCTLHFIKIASMDCPDVERWLGCRARGSVSTRSVCHRLHFKLASMEGPDVQDTGTPGHRICFLCIF